MAHGVEGRTLRLKDENRIVLVLIRDTGTVQPWGGTRLDGVWCGVRLVVTALLTPFH